jgi:hypothetical protein
MKRRLALAAAVAGVVLAVVTTFAPTPADSPPLRHAVRPSGPAVAASGSFPVADGDDETPWQSHADRLTTACGVDVASACTPAGCAALAVVPDLDQLRGWMELGWGHPGLVAGTVLADLGVVSRQSLPCDAALAATSTSAPTRVDIGDGPDGTWVACVWAPSASNGEATPCREAAARLGLPWTVSDPQRRW